METEKKQKTDNNGVKLGSDEANFLFSVYWSKTDRTKKFKEEEIGPGEFHHWGTKANIKERSVTLNNLVRNGGVKYGQDFKNTLNQILAELDLQYTIETVKTFKSCDNAVAYDIHSVPRWSFCGLGSTNEEAIARAARQGLEFFIGISS